MANVDNPHGFNFFKRLGPGAGVPIIRVVTESAITFAIGDTVVLSGGLAVLGAASHKTIFGVAQESVTGATGVRKSLAVIPALPDIIFEAQMDSLVSVAAMGGRFKIAGTTGIQEIDSTGGALLTDSVCPIRIVGLKPGDAWSSHADVLCVIAGSQFAGPGTSHGSLAG